MSANLPAGMTARGQAKLDDIAFAAVLDGEVTMPASQLRDMMRIISMLEDALLTLDPNHPVLRQADALLEAANWGDPNSHLTGEAQP